MKMEWKQSLDNFILEADDFYISYLSKIYDIGNHVKIINETALIKDNKYYILDGDWRQEYESLFEKGFEACKQFFIDHLEYENSYSSYD